jgi:hypothetical protein
LRNVDLLVSAHSHLKLTEVNHMILRLFKADVLLPAALSFLQESLGQLNRLHGIEKLGEEVMEPTLGMRQHLSAKGEGWGSKLLMEH